MVVAGLAHESGFGFEGHRESFAFYVCASVDCRAADAYGE